MPNRKLVYLTEIKTRERFREDNGWEFVLEKLCLTCMTDLQIGMSNTS